MATATRKASTKQAAFRLEQFANGAVAGVICLEAFRNKSLLEPVQKWIDEGKLKFIEGGSNILLDLLYLVEEKPTSVVKTEAPVASTRQSKRDTEFTEAVKGAAVIAAVMRAKAATQPLKGIAWVSIEMRFVDGLVLRAGTKVIEFDHKGNHKQDSGDVMAAQSCARRIESLTGQRPFIAEIDGRLRVLRREDLSERKPAE